LPHFGADILLQQSHEIESIDIVSVNYYPTRDDITIRPAGRQLPLSKEINPDYELIPNPKIYESTQAYPEKILSNISTHFLAGHSIGSFSICPVTYFPAKNQVKFLHQIILKIETKATNRAIESERFLNQSIDIEKRLAQIIDNPEMMGEYTYPSPKRDQEYDILLITNDELLPAFSDYIEFKESTGFIVTMVTTETIYTHYMGQDNQEKIRNCIIDYYINYGISYVILGGDSAPNNASEDIIPHRGFYADPGGGYADYDIPADMYYACLDGTWNDDGDNKWGEPGEDDLYAEVSIGRICVDSATEIQNHTNKLRMYQNEPVVADIEKALMVGEYLWPGIYGGTYKNEVYQGGTYNGYTTEGVSDNFSISTLYDLDFNWNKYDVFNHFNNVGINLRNHLGHSYVDYNMKMYNSDLTTSNFTNDGVNRGFVIGYSQGCYNGSFDNRDDWGSYYSEDCFAENITTLETADVATIGNSRYGWGDDTGTNGASQYFDRQFYDAIFGEDITIIGEANGDSKEDNASYILQDQVIRWCAYELTLFSDPTMDIWTAIPTEMNPTYPPSVPIGSSQIFFQTGTSFSRVGILQNGELIGRGVANMLGNVTVSLSAPISNPQPLEVSIIGHNKIRYQGTIIVVSDEPYVIFDSYQINDDGNGNGLADYGENISLDMTLENVGNQPAYNVLATISTEDEYITITDDSQDFGTIPAETLVTENDAFSFTIPDLIPDQHLIDFDLIATDDARETWNSFFTIAVNAPNLIVGGVIIDDSVEGDDDGRLDPGETVDIIITTNNDGHADSPPAVGSLVCSNEYITVNEGIFDFGIISANTTENAVFNITVSNDAPIGTSITLDYEVDAGNYGIQESFGMCIGLILEDFETGNFYSYPWEFGGDSDWFLTSVAYEGEFCAQSGAIGSWQTSSLIVSVYVLADGEISFWKKVSCEEDPNDNWDYFAFFIDGIEQGRWDGEVAWSEEVFSVTSGNHTFEWKYRKDGYVDSGADCAWIDFIVFPSIGEPLTPDISINPTEVEVASEQGGIATEQFTIENTGEADLEYSIYYSASNREDYEYSVPNSPSPSSWDYNTYTELGWTDVSVQDIGDIASWEISYTWDTDSWSYEGSFWVESPSGTQVPIASGDSDGSYTVSLDNFNSELMNGTWKIWIEDTYGDGGHQATNITMIITTLSPEESWLSVNPLSGIIAPGDSEQLDVICNATEIGEGEYSGVINVSSNDPDESMVTVPVSFIVGLMEVTQVIGHFENWNMIGLPLEVEDSYYLSLFPDAIEGTLYYFGDGYVQEEGDSLRAGIGYWLRFIEAGFDSIIGQSFDEVSIDLSEGWNLISGISTPVPVINIDDPSGIIIPNTCYLFNEGYVPASTIDPGKGYWIRASGEGEITIQVGARAARTTTFVDHLKGANTLEFSNSFGKSNLLYFGVTVPEKERLSYSLPPVPPSGFDVRFRSGLRFAEESGDIEVMNNSESLTISYTVTMEAGDYMEWVLISESDEEPVQSGPVRSGYVLDGNGEIVVEAPVERFTLTKRAIVPEEFALYQNYPNPFNPVTTIRYELPEESHVSIVVYDIMGRQVKELVSGELVSGYHTAIWDATDSFGKPVGAGIYLYQIKAGDFTQTRKMILLK
ncbi:MAG: T9SS type A sorting domain-containing protein, partial [Candidatus Marinimicrobia bacterium]|nr:T9SS type A sorting domain-containing protein [Candidatus Neomarinimicrobiota bacterium]